MKNAQPIYDSRTHYQIELWGRLDVEWLRSFENLAEISVDETLQKDDRTILDVHADQSGIVGLVGSLHGLGITIQKILIIP